MEADCLKYYTRQGSAGELKGIITLTASTVARLSKAPTATSAELELITAERTHRFVAKSQDDCLAWLHKLHETIVAVGVTKLKSSLLVEEGGKCGGKFGKWKSYHFVIREEDIDEQQFCRLLLVDNIERQEEVINERAMLAKGLTVDEAEQNAYFNAQIKHCTVSFPKTKRARQPWAFRIDTTKNRKLIINPGTEEDRDAVSHIAGFAHAGVILCVCLYCAMLPADVEIRKTT